MDTQLICIHICAAVALLALIMVVSLVIWRRRPKPIDLKTELLNLLIQTPGLDDVELADQLGKPPFVVSVALQEMVNDGLITQVVNEKQSLNSINKDSQ